MLWLDLTVASLLLWGAITGYYAGWRKAACGLGGLIGATKAALLGKTAIGAFWARRYPVEETIEALVNSRLALPVSGGEASFRFAPSEGLPTALWEALFTDPAVAAGNLQPVAKLLVQLLSCSAAFFAGLGLWWGFFHLCGIVLAGRENSGLSQPARWGGALIGMIRQCCCAALLIGMATPFGWLCGMPPDLLQLEKTLLARWAWQLFTWLGIWD